MSFVARAKYQYQFTLPRDGDFFVFLLLAIRTGYILEANVLG
jgi:hypothetical protein